MTPEAARAHDRLDLSECAREPIHIPGRIQPHGVLLAVSEPELRVQVVSENAGQLLGGEVAGLLGQDLAAVLGKDQVLELREHLGKADLASVNPLSLALSGPAGVGGSRELDVILHRSDGLLVLELEPADPQVRLSFSSFYRRVRGAVARLQAAPTVDDLCRIAAEETRRITGFDRVMVYRFDPEWNGEVVAEEKRAELEPFLGLHYPASDIPEQARRLYTVNWLRLIVDVDYQPVELVPERNPLTGRPLDLSFSVLRSVSPVHLEYLKNMGVGASMSVSLLRRDRLWGLIALHHETAKPLPYAVRSACEFIGQVFSLQLALREEQEEHDLALRLRQEQEDLTGRLSFEEDLGEALARCAEELLPFVRAHGATFVLGGPLRRVGNAPDEEMLRTIRLWLEETHPEEDVYATDALPALCSGVDADVAAGLLALRISRSDYLFWFRPEVVREVNWGGDPQKPVRVTPAAVGEDGARRLHPRASFELWKEVVRGRAAPWRPGELEAAAGLRNDLVDLTFRRSEERSRRQLEALNAELARSNQELDAFAYTASHDLKEPLRGIRNYAAFLLEDYGEALDDDGRRRLETISRLTDRLQGFIEALLHFSRVGRTELGREEVDLNAALGDVLALLQPRLEEAQAEVRVPRRLPVVLCDRIRIGEVFHNLITNGIKYNEQEQKFVEVGYTGPEEQPVFYVRDNGIGIAEKHQGTVFDMFHRLHPRDRFGGGSGAGLTIARKIVERHGGRLWLESKLGEGTTFYFTLSDTHGRETQRGNHG